MRHLFFAATLAAALPFPAAAGQFEKIAPAAKGRVGVAAQLLESGETADLHGDDHFPMPAGWNCSWNPGSSARKNSLRYDKNGASGKQCDIDGQPKRASVWENASQCEELTAIFVTILKRAKTS